MKQPPMTPMVIRLDAAMHTALERLAAGEQRSISQMARVLLVEAIATRAKLARIEQLAQESK